MTTTGSAARSCSYIKENDISLNADDDIDAEDDDAEEDVEHQNRTSRGSEDNSSSLITFGSAAEQVAVYADRLANAIQMKERALSLFEKQRIVRLVDDVENNNEGENHDINDEPDDEDLNYQYVVTIPSAKKMLFDLVLRYISCGVSFRMTRNILQHTAEVFGSRIVCSRGDVSKMARAACAANLQQLADILKSSWAFSIAIDSATHQSTSYLDLRFRVFGKRNREIFNLHGCALPINDRHTGEVMHDMVSKFLSVLCPDWKISMLGVASDGARNMTGRAAGVVTRRLQTSMHEHCPLLRIWCGAHQFDLVMEYIMTKVVNDRFFSVLLKFIAHLSRQQKVIADMGTTCPRIVNRWLSSYKVTNWFKRHRPELLHHIRVSNPASAPSRIWWVYLMAMDDFTNNTAITFRYIQGSTTLISQQNAAFQRLVATFIEDVRSQGPFTSEEIA